MYIMDQPALSVKNFMENAIGPKGVKYGIKNYKAMCNVCGAKGLLEIN